MNLAWFNHTNGGSRPQIWALLPRSKKLFFRTGPWHRWVNVEKHGLVDLLGYPQNFFDIFSLDRFDFWIPTSWGLICLDLCQSISWRSFGPLKVALGPFLASALFNFNMELNFYLPKVEGVGYPSGGYFLTLLLEWTVKI